MAGLLPVRGESGAWFGFALPLLLMSMDEVAQLHEKVEKYSDIDFQTVYIPVFAVAAWIWWRLIRAGGRPARAARGWCGQPRLLAVPRACPVRRRRRARRAVRPMAITEEILEMIGSTMFLLAVVILLRATRERR